MTNLGDILILGLGSSGRAAARYCAELIGTEASSVTAVDTADTEAIRAEAAGLAEIGVSVSLGVEAVEGRWSLCIASPGIPPHAPLMASARACCDEVVSEIEFAYRRSSCPWVAVTGTNGKTTTTALITHMLNGAGVPARAVGNIGDPAIEAVARAGESEVLVAEVSSFQLALTSRFHPRVAVLLNITPDHIDWHGSLEAYTEDKAKVFANLGASDVAVIDVDDPGAAPFAERVAARGVPVVRVSRHRERRGEATLEDGFLALESHGEPARIAGIDELRIKGPHNVSNALAAAAAVHALGVPVSDLAWGLTSFAPIEHRLEPVAEIGGVEWFNDSKATNPDAVIKALGAFDGRPLVLLLGGRNKGNDFDELARAVSESPARGVVVFGESAETIGRSFEGREVPVATGAGLADAVEAAARIAHPGDAVALSPACASFDEFANYEERGRAFKRLVNELSGERDSDG